MWARCGARVSHQGGYWWAGRESNLQSKTADLQSAELTTCSTYPRGSPRSPGTSPDGEEGTKRGELFTWSRRRDSNPEPAVYKTAALPIELRRRDWGVYSTRPRTRNPACRT